MEFHISCQARDRYQFDQILFSLRGGVIFANFQAARLFSQKINQTRNLTLFPEQAVQAGDINAMGMIDEILHAVISAYRQKINPHAFSLAIEWIKERLGEPAFERALIEFGTEFPPQAVYHGDLSLTEYLSGVTEGIPNDQVMLEEMLLLWLDNKNPAFILREELFDDTRLSSESAYSQIIAEMYRFFMTQPPAGPDKQNLIDLLRMPAVMSPHSLLAQLEYIRDRWGDVLEGRFADLLRRIIAGMDLIREEQTPRGFFGPGPVEVPKYSAEGLQGAGMEMENFSQDTDWMPRLVLIAKNTFVWLDQLSQVYGYKISRLDQIPDEELQRLASWGFTGLWLIGLWERSRASARIKQMMGNSEAIASAYSLFDYCIADELGGEDAYRGLREKAWRYGIRLASDMVPNHMGIDSTWVAEHPDWFLSLDYSPYPAYSFNSPDLSVDGRVSIHLEDHYFTQSDAAVVFKLYDHRDGRTHFIYHGNDGTTMPWNDTAQLNYLKAEVREAVIQTILSVARRFPIIRFDAAMTLAKLHYQRLWFPQPGSSGAIPSRSEFGMSKEQFDQIMPVEFWREVVDRVAQEAPDTLLLAEAFWLMESYFVRTLGMHRVYNSAFMNLLRDEDNAKYRQIMKNTLEFDPEILKRYVNFMNNPDERTAVDQFGKGDKYFGIATLLSTLPGLPMFGHGQVEGYSEKYGMEFKRAYWNEQPDPYLVGRHQVEIFPILHRRALFAGVDQFLLYDFYMPHGEVDEDVYAYSNGLNSDRALVVFHNRFSETQGRVNASASYSVKMDNGERRIVQSTLARSLDLHAGSNTFVLFRDVITGLEYIRSSQTIIEQGLFFSLRAYEYHVFVDFREVIDNEWGSYRQVMEYLGGRGTPSVERALQELALQPVLTPLRQLLNPGYMRYLFEMCLDEPEEALPAGLIPEGEAKLNVLIDGIEQYHGNVHGRERLSRELRIGLRLLLSLPTFEARYPLPGARKYRQALKYLSTPPGEAQDTSWLVLYAWGYLRNLGILSGQEDWKSVTLGWYQDWLVGRVFVEMLQELGVEETQAFDLSGALQLLIEHQGWFDSRNHKKAVEYLRDWIENSAVQRFWKVHRYDDMLWFNKERFEIFIWWMTVIAVMDSAFAAKANASLLVERLLLVDEVAQEFLKMEDASDFKLAGLLEAKD